MSRKPDPRSTVRRFLRWLGEAPRVGECCSPELHPLEAPSVRIRNLIEALRDPEALVLFLRGVFCLTEAALALGMSEQAVLGLVERGELRGLRVGGDRKWVFACRRVIELMKRAQAADKQEVGIGVRAAEAWFRAHGYQGFGCDEQP
jgi:hypothetical protein